MAYTEFIGFAAGTLTSLAFLPQVIKVWKTKSTKDISLLMFIILCSGAFLWFIYGIIINSLPVILANAITFVLAIIILIFKIRYK